MNTSINDITIVFCYILILTYIGINYYSLFNNLSRTHLYNEEYEEYDLSTFRASQNCFLNRIKYLDDNQIWNRFEFIANRCEARLYENVIKYPNKDEDKYFYGPKNKSYECTIVTLGIGNDILAERAIKNDFPSCNFYGADPNSNINKVLFETIGIYFPLAVAANTTNSTSNVLVLPEKTENNTLPVPIYEQQTLEHISLPEFLNDIISKPTIDLLLIDIEGDEYGILQYFYGTGSQISATICQINIEAHFTTSPIMRRQFAEFVRNVAHEGYYHFKKASTFIGHNRIYLLSNDPKCMN